MRSLDEAAMATGVVADSSRLSWRRWWCFLLNKAGADALGWLGRVDIDCG